MQYVAVFLVHNEDVFIERSVRNVAAFCDRIFVVDHMSTDSTAEILRRLAGEFDHVSVRRSQDAADSHAAIESFAGTETWVLGVDGDELYDPDGLARLRSRLDDKAHADVFRLKGHVLNCDELDVAGGRATGFVAPPSRPVTKLFNMAAVDSWTGCLERLHDGVVSFRAGFGWESMRYLSDDCDWESDPLRMLHTCFLKRSTDDEDAGPRKGLPETGGWRRGWRGSLDRFRRARALDPRIKDYNRSGTSWKQEWYALGPRVTVDACPFLGLR